MIVVGKSCQSLFLDTLAELFSGSEALFRGLEVHGRWDWSRRYPVIRLSFSDGVLHSRDQLDERIGELLAENEARLGVASTHTSLSGRFGGLIRAAAERHGERVVVLIDEYDKPILDLDASRGAKRRHGLRSSADGQSISRPGIAATAVVPVSSSISGFA